MERLIGLLGIVALLAIALLFSSNRRWILALVASIFSGIPTIVSTKVLKTSLVIIASLKLKIILALFLTIVFVGVEEKALAYSVQSSSVEEIDAINILNASFKAMHKAIAALAIRPELLLIDGNRFPAYLGIPHQCIVKGDGKIMSIAAASVLAKTYRDEYMEQIDKEFPAYNWAQNKGYGTLDHRKKICSLGLSPHHRKSFQLKAQLK